MKAAFLRISMVISAILLISNLLFSQGTLDPNFGNGGFVISKIQGARDDISQSVAIQSDRKIVVAGNSFDWLGYSNIGIIRYKASGKIDKTFNLTGKKIINDGFCNIVAIQSDGKIVIGGSVAQGSSSLFGVWRINANGSTDNTFGTNGFKGIPFSGYVICFSMIIQPDGKILIAGNDGNFYAGHASMAIARLNTDGSLDNTFSGDGKFTLNLTNKSLECQRLLLQPDGKIIAAGTLDTIIQTAFFRNEFFCTRLNSDGTIDNTFGTNGIFRQRNSNSDNCYSAGLMSDGKIIMAGFSEFTSYNAASALCLNSTGTLDITYGTNGWQYIDFYNNSSAIIYGLAIQKNDKAVLAGTAYFPNQTNAVVLARLNATGTLDPSFGNGGIDTFFLSTAMQPVGCNDVVLQKDGKIVITGYRMLAHDAFLTARFLNANQLEKIAPAETVTTSSIYDVTIYPNPVSYNPMILSFSLAKPSRVEILLSDMNGQQLSTPIAQEFPDGPNTFEINFADELPHGMYLCTLYVNNEVQTIKFEVGHSFDN